MPKCLMVPLAKYDSAYLENLCEALNLILQVYLFRSIYFGVFILKHFANIVNK